MNNSSSKPVENAALAATAPDTVNTDNPPNDDDVQTAEKKEQESWSNRLKYSALAFLLQKCVMWPAETIASIHRDYLGLGPAESRPDLIKTFPAAGGKGLAVRYVNR